MAKKTVAFMRCACGKRGFADEHDADKALGRAQSKRRRALDSAGSRRGVVKMESRFYPCEVGELYHLTGESKQSYNTHAVPVPTWDEYLASQNLPVAA